MICLDSQKLLKVCALQVFIKCNLQEFTNERVMNVNIQSFIPIITLFIPSLSSKETFLWLYHFW